MQEINTIDYTSLSRTLDHLTKAGYTVEFQLQQSGLYCPDLDSRLTPDEFDVMSVYHFNQPLGEEERILYVISSLPGLLGTLVLTTSEAYSEGMTFEMAGKLRTHPYGEWICS
ncbi:MAG TPA: hypothetical protein VF191_04855 [Cyclobacteriaceae bacterium]